MINQNAYQKIKEELDQKNVRLVAVSKLQPDEKILEIYNLGHRIFGENRATDMKRKYEIFPKSIQWHMIGHLQTNKVRAIIPFVELIHSIDSFRLLQLINQEALKLDKKVNCLLQVHIAKEESKTGFDEEELREMLASPDLLLLRNITICGLMGMATFTDDENQILKEFRGLRKLFDEIRNNFFQDKDLFSTLSMGMSGDYKIAVDEGSTMVRIGTLIFGERGKGSD